MRESTVQASYYPVPAPVPVSSPRPSSAIFTVFYFFLFPQLETAFPHLVPLFCVAHPGQLAVTFWGLVVMKDA